MLKNIRKSNEGFTIIEVLIVLAIAGLILLIVFLAVPALQRNARNTSRKNDVASILSAVSEYGDNNQGVLPVTGQFSTEFTHVTPNLGYYTTPANVQWHHGTVATAGTDPNNLDKVNLYDFAKCAGNNGSTTGATARSVIALYDVEGSGGDIVPQCQESGA